MWRVGGWEIYVGSSRQCPVPTFRSKSIQWYKRMMSSNEKEISRWVVMKLIKWICISDGCDYDLQSSCVRSITKLSPSDSRVRSMIWGGRQVWKIKARLVVTMPHMHWTKSEENFSAVIPGSPKLSSWRSDSITRVASVIGRLRTLRFVKSTANASY